MRRFSFTAKNIGRERYLTYIMGEGMDVDEDVLDFCEDNELPGILDIIYEEDDDFDYLTYDITGLISLEKYTQDVMNREIVFKVLRNISLGMISIKENALPLSYILLNKGFMYIDPDTFAIRFLYLPVEGEASVSTEFKSFVRQLMAGMKYNVEEDLSYVGQLITYVNGDSFNLRGLIGLTEALMQDAGISYSEEEGISTDDGTEIISGGAEEEAHEKGAMDFMSGLEGADDKLPEIGDDEEDDIELEDAAAEAEEAPVEAAEEAPAEEEAPAPIPESEPLPEIQTEREAEHTETIEDIKAKLEEIAGAVADEQKGIKRPKKEEPKPAPAHKNTVRVSRAAMLKAAEEAIEEEEAAAAAAAAEAEAAAAAEAEAAATEAETTATEAVAEAAETAEAAGEGEVDASKAAEEKEIKKEAKKEPAKKTEVIDNTILGSTGSIKINPYIIRVNTEERIMINKPVFKIGKASRGVDYRVNGNGAISRQHAIILHKGDSYYIKDNKSTNHTYVNNVEVKDEEEVLLKNNSTIKLGDEEFTFKLG